MILIGIFLVTAVVIGGLTHVAAAGIVLGVLAAGLFYVQDVKRHDRVPCRWPGCKGSGAKFSRLGGGEYIRRPFGDCWCCGGRKSHPRLALKLIDGNRYDKIRDEIIRGRKGI